MRRSLAGLALIRREASGHTGYLVQWNANWQRFSLVGGNKHDDESFRECLIRELFEELGLHVESDLQVSDQPIARAEYTCWSESAKQHTRYELELFDITVFTPVAMQQINDNRLNRWVSIEEIGHSRCDDGRPIDGSVERLLQQAGLPAPRPPSAARSIHATEKVGFAADMYDTII